VNPVSASWNTEAPETGLLAAISTNAAAHKAPKTQYILMFDFGEVSKKNEDRPTTEKVVYYFVGRGGVIEFVGRE
jgi:hypothetical protein